MRLIPTPKSQRQKGQDDRDDNWVTNVFFCFPALIRVKIYLMFWRERTVIKVVLYKTEAVFNA